MKKMKKFLAAATLIVLAGCTSTLPLTTKAEPAVGVSFQFFYDNLSPYGAWVSYPGYGYAWVPRVSVGFRPYFSDGQWVMTDLGWTWVSFYDWGWAPFHYGSWLYDPFYGWLWVPGYSWAPAWVTWGYYSGYYGWAPLAPGISFSIGYYPPIDYWVFVPPRYVTVSGWNNNYYVASQHRITISNNTTINNVNNINIVNNTGTYNGQRFSAGPPRAEFEKASNTRVSPVSIRERSSPGRAQVSGNNLNIYRPAVDAKDKATAKPSKITPLETMKRPGAEKPNADRIKNQGNTERTAPQRINGAKEKAPVEKAVPQQRENKMKEQQSDRNVKEQPKMQQRKQDAAPREIQKRNKNANQGPKLQQREAKPKSNVESSPQMNRRSAEPAPGRQHDVRQSQPRPERIQGPPREEQQRMAPERKEMPQRQVEQYRPQQMERESHGRNPK